MTHHEHHHHEHEGGESYGIALGFRIFDNEGKLFLAEVEVTPYMDEPNALGATLVFHPLDDFDPTSEQQEEDWPTWPVDIDDDLTRDTGEPLPAQFTAILRQVSGFSEGQLREYLDLAQQAAEAAEE